MEHPAGHRFHVHRENGLGSRDHHLPEVVEIERVVLAVRLEVAKGMERAAVGEHEIQAVNPPYFWIARSRTAAVAFATAS